jgi:hypothetical protein
MFIPAFESRRSTCLIVCLGNRPRASASPCPIVFTAREAVLMTPSVAFANAVSSPKCNSAA